MKKFLLVFTLILSLILSVKVLAAETNIEDMQLDMRGYDMIEIPAGTFIPVMNTQEISTANCSEGYKVKFVATTDLYMYDTTVVPQDTVFLGYIEKMNEPVVGTNASMIIKISKMVLSDGFEIPMRGYIYTDNNNLIGGGISDPVSWVKVPHYQTAFKIVNLQLKPSMERQMGKHVSINAGSNEIIVLTSPMYITHTLLNN